MGIPIESLGEGLEPSSVTKYRREHACGGPWCTWTGGKGTRQTLMPHLDPHKVPGGSKHKLSAAQLRARKKTQLHRICFLMDSCNFSLGDTGEYMKTVT